MFVARGTVSIVRGNGDEVRGFENDKEAPWEEPSGGGGRGVSLSV